MLHAQIPTPVGSPLMLMHSCATLLEHFKWGAGAEHVAGRVARARFELPGLGHAPTAGARP